MSYAERIKWTRDADAAYQIATEADQYIRKLENLILEKLEVVDQSSDHVVKDEWRQRAKNTLAN